MTQQAQPQQTAVPHRKKPQLTGQVAAASESSAVFAPGQWRLAQVEVANWGTFDQGITTITVSRKGHLLTGPSGSGKSSLLDAIAAVMTPDKWLRFNQAAQVGGGRADQRSLISYVRGAWSRTTDDTLDKVVSQFLRPTATWSGVLLRYENGVDSPITLARLFFLKGTSTASADLENLCLIERSAIGLADLQGFVHRGPKTRELQKRFPGALVTSTGKHARYFARVKSLFGMRDEISLQLLHKTQSAKSLNTLDQLFRDYMLERPDTFDLADNAVTQFAELQRAHAHVVRLREQRDLLAQLAQQATKFDAAKQDATRARVLGDAVGPYQKLRHLGLCQTDLDRVTQELIILGAAQQRAKEATNLAQEDFDQARDRIRGLGGYQIEALQGRIAQAHGEITRVDNRWQLFADDLGRASITTVPTTSGEFAELKVAMERQLSVPSAAGPSHQIQERFFSQQKVVRQIAAQIKSMEMTNSSVPRPLLAVRQELSEHSGIPVSALPFAAELLTVKPEFAPWTGAIERVLRGFALTLLVRQEHVDQVRRWVDRHRIRARLVYEVVPTVVDSPGAARSPDSLVHRVAVTSGPFAQWVAGQLSARFDYSCVDSADSLGDFARAVTIRGQMKTSATRYLKDDRTAIDNRSQWLLGDQEATLDALEEQRRVAQTDLDQAQNELTAAQAVYDSANRQRALLDSLRQRPWADIDRDAARLVLADLEQKLGRLTQDSAPLDQATREMESARSYLDRATRLYDQARDDLAAAKREQNGLIKDIAVLRAETELASFAKVPQEVTADLDRKFRKTQRSITRANLYEIGLEVSQHLGKERDQALDQVRVCGAKISGVAATFKERWPASAADLSTEVADRQRYVEILTAITKNDLPKHEKNFLNLLQERSRDMVGELVDAILDGPRTITTRVTEINKSLGRSEFDRDRFLQLRPRVQRTATVTQFLNDLRSISEGSWGTMDQDDAERRFLVLAGLMQRLSSSDYVDRTWRNQCLDSRLHVTFLADEVDKHGQVQATYDSGAAMSGGQQQKLVIFCLAAALRYQLASPDQVLPLFGTIILDEAFDKADSSYTRMALNVFLDFGFHLVLATPQKLLQTIEPYVGAATAIENPTRKRTLVSQVQWQEQL
ncbi:ATP-binding protein [Jonesiaceae bacterium BS-20]|uniref:ATP-binding protein n=1 Tax=Jonesiaceae bacterium BS-20 TaxID=3120821 RepID=A0AAU7DT11_9MICO